MGKIGKILECSILDGKKSFGPHKKIKKINLGLSKSY